MTAPVGSSEDRFLGRVGSGNVGWTINDDSSVSESSWYCYDGIASSRIVVVSIIRCRGPYLCPVLQLQLSLSLSHLSYPRKPSIHLPQRSANLKNSFLSQANLPRL